MSLQHVLSGGSGAAAAQSRAATLLPHPVQHAEPQHQKEPWRKKSPANVQSPGLGQTPEGVLIS